MERQIVVLTPVRNEAWILENFLTAVSSFADRIIVLDQSSEDGSREIASRFPKVVLVDNPSQEFNEKERQNILLMEARKLGTGQVLVALDADEIPSPDFYQPEFQRMLRTSPEGTVFQFDWLNLEPGLGVAYRSPMAPMIFVDDGSENSHDVEIHRTRLPVPNISKLIPLKSPTILHFQYVCPGRLALKQQWYQVLERVKFPNKSRLEIYRQYHHLVVRDRSRFERVPEEWEDFLKRLSLSVGSLCSAAANPVWEREVRAMIEEFGVQYFRDIDLPGFISAGSSQRWLIRYASQTQGLTASSSSSVIRLFVRAFDKLLIKFFGA